MKIFFIFFILTFLFSGCFSVKSLSIGKVQDFNLDGFSENELSFSFKVNIKNPNNFKIRITKVKLNASFDNKAIGEVKEVNNIIILPNSNQIHEIIAKIQLSENYRNISDLIQLSMNRSSLKFDGYVKFKTFLFSKKIPVEDKNIMKMLNN